MYGDRRRRTGRRLDNHGHECHRHTSTGSATSSLCSTSTMTSTTITTTTSTTTTTTGQKFSPTTALYLVRRSCFNLVQTIQYNTSYNLPSPYVRTAKTGREKEESSDEKAPDPAPTTARGKLYLTHIVNNLLCRTWDAAQADCQSQNANLMKIDENDDVNENAWLTGTLHICRYLRNWRTYRYVNTHIHCTLYCICYGQ